MNNETEILLRLRRQYTESEALQLAMQEVDRLKSELSKERVENGKLVAEVAYLESEIKQLKTMVVDEDKIHQHPLYKALLKSQQKFAKQAQKAEYELAIMRGTVRERLWKR